MRRTVRAVRILARDGGLPRWLRVLAAAGLAPIPGPFDEALLLVVAAILWLGYRERLRAAWRAADYREPVSGFDERRARNEAFFRETNERLEALGLELGDGTLELVCECSDPSCSQAIAIPLAAYEAVRDDARRFIVAPGHARAELERVIERHADYFVVEKSGEAGEVAEETDPRPND